MRLKCLTSVFYAKSIPITGLKNRRLKLEPRFSLCISLALNANISYQIPEYEIEKCRKNTLLAGLSSYLAQRTCQLGNDTNSTMGSGSHSSSCHREKINALTFQKKKKTPISLSIFTRFPPCS